MEGKKEGRKEVKEGTLHNILT